MRHEWWYCDNEKRVSRKEFEALPFDNSHTVGHAGCVHWVTDSKDCECVCHKALSTTKTIG